MRPRKDDVDLEPRRARTKAARGAPPSRPCASESGAPSRYSRALAALASMREAAPMLSSSTFGLMPPEGLLIHEPTFL